LVLFGEIEVKACHWDARRIASGNEFIWKNPDGDPIGSSRKELQNFVTRDGVIARILAFLNARSDRGPPRGQPINDQLIDPSSHRV
jgi:hypothetical protein